LISLDDLQKALDEFQRVFEGSVAFYKKGLRPNARWISANIERLQKLFSSFKAEQVAKEQALRKLWQELKKNEKEYEESKDDYDLSDSMQSYLNGRISESQVIRIQLEKIFDETFPEEKKP